MAPPESRGMQNASLWRGLYRLQKDSSMKGHECGGELEKYATFGTGGRPNGTAQMQKEKLALQDHRGIRFSGEAKGRQALRGVAIAL
jgi:hypothetical protein